MHETTRVGFRAALVYAALVIPWPGLQTGYARVFRAAGHASTSALKPWVEVRWREYSGMGATLDTEIAVRRPAGHRSARLVLESRRMGFIPLALFSALLVATPMRRAQRLKAAMVGFALLDVFVACRILIPVLLAGSEGVNAAFTVSPWARSILMALEQAVTVRSASSFVAPVLVWFWLALRSGAWIAGGAPGIARRSYSASAARMVAAMESGGEDAR